jgi:hypothetical protein
VVSGWAGCCVVSCDDGAFLLLDERMIVAVVVVPFVCLLCEVVLQTEVLLLCSFKVFTCCVH